MFDVISCFYKIFILSKEKKKINYKATKTKQKKNESFHHGLQSEDERSLCSSNDDDGLDVFDRSDAESGRDLLSLLPPQRLNQSLTIV